MSNKDVGLRIRVERELREEFQKACLAENVKASEVLREFMQAYALKSKSAKNVDACATRARKLHPKIKSEYP